MHELAALALEDAFRLAIIRSAYSPSELAARLGWKESFLRRVTANEKYYPSVADIPAFCLAVGNSLIIDWLSARVAFPEFAMPQAGADAEYLRDQVLELTSEMGKVADKVRVAVNDNRVTKQETRIILKEVLLLAETATKLAGALRHAERKVARHD